MEKEKININIDNLICKFPNGRERFLKSPHLNSVIQSLARGQDPIIVIDELLIIIENQNGTRQEPEKKQYGNERINGVISYMSARIDVMDGTQKSNRQYTNLLIKKVEKEFPNSEPVIFICKLISDGLQVDWIKDNLTSIKFLYYNMGKILNASKPKEKKEPTVKMEGSYVKDMQDKNRRS